MNKCTQCKYHILLSEDDSGEYIIEYCSKEHCEEYFRFHDECSDTDCPEFEEELLDEIS